MGLGFSALQLDLVGTSSLQDLQQRLKAYAAASPGARWIVGRGWNQELWPVKNFPTAADLDVSKFPVSTSAEESKLAADLANPASIKALCAGLVPPGAGDDSKSRFALSALIRFLMDDCCQGHPEVCAPVAAALSCCP